MATFIFAAIGGVLYGYDLGIISGALLFIRKSIPMTDNQMSFLVAAVLGGGSIATLVTGPLSDWFGRRRMILLSSVIFIISVFIIVFAHAYGMLLFGRLVQGVGVGVITIAVPLYLTEVMPRKWRARGVTAFQLLLTVGILLATLVGALFAHFGGNWRAMFLTAGIPGVVMFFGCFFLTDSPRWLAMKGRYDAALAVLKKTRPLAEAKRELAQMKKALLSGKKGLHGQGEIWQKRYLFPPVIVFSVGILNQLTGINYFLQFSAIFFKTAGLSFNMVAIGLDTLFLLIEQAIQRRSTLMTPLTIVADMYARPERLDEIKAALIALIERTRAQAGCVNYDLHQDNNDPHHFLFYENWAELWQAHRDSSHLNAFRKAMDGAFSAFTVSQITQIV